MSETAILAQARLSESPGQRERNQPWKRQGRRLMRDSSAAPHAGAPVAQQLAFDSPSVKGAIT